MRRFAHSCRAYSGGTCWRGPRLEVVLLEADPTSHLLEPYIERFVEVLRAWAVQQQEDEAEAMLKHSSSSGSGVDTDTPAEARGRYELELFLEDAVFKLHSALVIARVCQKKQNADPTNRRFFATFIQLLFPFSSQNLPRAHF